MLYDFEVARVDEKHAADRNQVEAVRPDHQANGRREFWALLPVLLCEDDVVYQAQNIAKVENDQYCD